MQNNNYADGYISKLEAVSILRRRWPHMSNLELNSILLKLSPKWQETFNTPQDNSTSQQNDSLKEVENIEFSLNDIMCRGDTYKCLRSLVENYRPQSCEEYLSFDNLRTRNAWKGKNENDILEFIKDLVRGKKLRIYSSERGVPGHSDDEGEWKISEDCYYGEDARRLIDQEKASPNLQEEYALFNLEEILVIEKQYFPEEQESETNKKNNDEKISIDLAEKIIKDIQEGKIKLNIITKEKFAKKIFKRGQEDNSYSKAVKTHKTVMRHLSGKFKSEYKPRLKKAEKAQATS